MHVFNRWTRHSEGSHERQQVEEAAGKRCHLQEHLTLITPVGILAQPFVFKCVLNIITVRREGKEAENCKWKWSTCTVRTRKKGQVRASLAYVLHLITCAKWGAMGINTYSDLGYSILELRRIVSKLNIESWSMHVGLQKWNMFFWVWRDEVKYIHILFHIVWTYFKILFFLTLKILRSFVPIELDPNFP